MSTAILTDNATTVAKMYQAFSRGDIPYILSNVADDCTWIGAGEGSLPQGGMYIGKDAIRFFRQLEENEEFNSFNVTSINNINDVEVVAFGDMKTTSKTTGNKIACDWTMHWKFNEEGKAVYFHDFFDTAAAYLAEQKETQTSKKEHNISIVKRAFENFSKGNIQGILDCCTNDVVWGSHENLRVPYAKTFYGKQGAGEFFSLLSESINYLAFEPKEYYADGDKVFVKGNHKATVKSTGKSFAHDLLMEFTLKDGKICSFFAWVDTHDQAQAFQA
ncbi:nuclear transport factor 2 family protein [Segetibacter koreensis]|uniref:nuclear transport factor 2 family protein n=1 Tax=Segetibacter koreensis TaxID=398037 RepID=UPI00037EEAB7|nr:nuclear transport factor 2 family protein [Segetibacter koreensis]